VLAAGLLDGGVELVDVFVGLGNDGDAAAGSGVVDPRASRLGDELLEGAFGHAAVVDVGVEGLRIARPQLQGRGLLPWLPEAVDGDQLVAASAAAELVEHAAAADGLELAGVADEDQSPALGHGERDELVEGAGAGHACFVQDEGGAGWQPVGVGRLPLAPFVEQLGDGVGGDAGLGAQDLAGLGCRSDSEHGPVVVAEVVGGAAQHRGLAGAGRPDDEDEPSVAGHGGGCVGLEDI
jgi:hypothetical protein